MNDMEHVKKVILERQRLWAALEQASAYLDEGLQSRNRLASNEAFDAEYESDGQLAAHLNEVRRLLTITRALLPTTKSGHLRVPTVADDAVVALMRQSYLRDEA